MYILTQIKVTDEMLRPRGNHVSLRQEIVNGIVKRAPEMIFGEQQQRITENELNNLTANLCYTVGDAFEAHFLDFVDLRMIYPKKEVYGLAIQLPAGHSKLERKVSGKLSALEQALVDGQYDTKMLHLDVCTEELTTEQLIQFMKLARMYEKREASSRRLYFEKAEPRAKSQGGKLVARTGTMGGHVISGTLIFTPGNGTELDGRLNSLIDSGYRVIHSMDISPWTKLDIVVNAERVETERRKLNLGLLSLPVGKANYKSDVEMRIKVDVSGAKYELTDPRLTGTRTKVHANTSRPNRNYGSS